MVITDVVCVILHACFGPVCTSECDTVHLNRCIVVTVKGGHLLIIASQWRPKLL